MNFRAEDKQLIDSHITAMSKETKQDCIPEVTLKDYIKSIEDKYPEEEAVKYKHYFKDVSNLKRIDVYRVISLWGVTDPCIQHAIKKLLAAGNRGYKDVEKDIQEAIDSLLRWKDMQEEDNGC